jgi:hypothetical protein
MHEDIRARFLAKVQTGCHIWTGAKLHGGHGTLKVNGKNMQAHRISYEMTNGPIPAVMVVRHKCDVPACVNPDHLEIGTQGENVRDRDERKRTPYGATHYRAILTEEAVAVIRGSDEPGVELARRYGVTDSAISQIRSGRLWKHSPGPIRKGRRSKVSADAVRAIRASTERSRVLAERYGVSEVTISSIRQRKTHREVE